MVMVEFRCPKCRQNVTKRVDENKHDPQTMQARCPDCGTAMSYVNEYEDVSGCPEYVGDDDD